MDFGKYYDVSNIVEDMMANEEIYCYPTGNNKYCGVYVCMDTNDFWICRILNGYNEEYEESENLYLVERNKISIYTVMDKLSEMSNRSTSTFTFKKSESAYTIKNKCHEFIDTYSTEKIIKAVILLDDEDGLGNWDCCEVYSLEEAIDIIDGGYGILNAV